jgi:Ca2+-binding RTX toxin-like protein
MGDVTLRGGDGNDVLWGSGGNDVIDGGNGNDNVDGGAGNDVVSGGMGVDKVAGGAGNDTLNYNADAVWGGGFVAYNTNSGETSGSLQGMNRSEDVFLGGSGNDVIQMTGGNDVIFSDDSYTAAAQTGARVQDVETINAGDGNDIVDLTSTSYKYGDVTINGGAGNDYLWSMDGKDAIFGGDGSDHMHGGKGHDFLDGGAGDDIIRGGEGKDTITGGLGNDTFTGGNTAFSTGNESDLYIYDLTTNQGKDTVTGHEYKKDDFQFSGGTAGSVTVTGTTGSGSFTASHTASGTTIGITLGGNAAGVTALDIQTQDFLFM